MSITTSLRDRTGLLAVSGGALLWGTTGVAVRIIHDRSGLSAVSIGWYRVAIAALVVALVFRSGGARRAADAFRRHPVALVVSGVGFGAYQALYFVGVQYVGVSVSTLVSLGVAPVALTVGAAVAGRRLPSAGALAVLACALSGLALISLRSGGTGTIHPVIGVLASIASGLGYAAITGLSRWMSEEDPLLLTGVTSAVATVILLPVAVPSGLAFARDATAGWWLIYIGVVPTVAAYWLFYRGLRSIPTEVAGVLTLLEPLAAAVLAAIVLHESLPRWSIVGASLMLVAVASLYVRRPVSEAPPPP
ncbi:MAG: drug/metabolite transporter, family [Pseudonocardiales bacterium]|nr:drug/metabolite transporter, family [Pseudonocardiales bacterium]